MDPIDVQVGWEVATDEVFAAIVQSGIATASPEWAHSVHVEVETLTPGQTYWYRFFAGDAVSPVGRTRTAPADGSPTEHLRFGFASCANWEHGYFSARTVILPNNRSISSSFSATTSMNTHQATITSPRRMLPIRLHTGGEVLTLADYRNRHALYKTDPDLQQAHRAHPWIVTWDDHEVENNYVGDTSGNELDPATFLARKTAAYQAYYEHMPLRVSAKPVGPTLPLYRRLTFGRQRIALGAGHTPISLPASMWQYDWTPMRYRFRSRFVDAGSGPGRMADGPPRHRNGTMEDSGSTGHDGRTTSTPIGRRRSLQRRSMGWLSSCPESSSSMR